MKPLLTLSFTFLILSSYGQDKAGYTAYNRLTDLAGTDYLLASVDSWSKMSFGSSYLMFINTQNGESKQIDFPKDAYIEKIEQIKLDSLNINKVIVTAKTINLDGNKSIDWNDPKQIIVFSTDGKEREQVTADNFFVSTWTIKRQTGVIVISGHVDTNGNGKYDKADKAEIIVYDLKAMKLLAKI